MATETMQWSITDEIGFEPDIIFISYRYYMTCHNRMGSSSSAPSTPEGGAATVSVSQPPTSECRQCQDNQSNALPSQHPVSTGVSECPVSAGSGSGCPIMSNPDAVDPNNMVNDLT